MNEELISGLDENVISLTEAARFVPDGIVSRTLLSKPGFRTVLFAFAEGQELTEHTSPQHALVQILSGSCEFSLAGKPKALRTGDMLYMPPNLAHAVKATEQFSMLLTLAKPGTAQPTGPKPSRKPAEEPRVLSGQT